MNYDVKMLPVTGAAASLYFGYWMFAIGTIIAVYAVALYINKRKRLN